MSVPAPIERFTELLGHECDGAEVAIDAPRNPEGEHWLDISLQDFRVSVSWRPRIGFGVFASESKGYGERPDEIYARPEDACTRICQLIARSHDSPEWASMELRELRHIVGRSQVEIAQALDVNQAVVSRIEARGDMRLSSLLQYISAMGGKLELRARFKDFETRIEPGRAARQKAAG